MGSDGSHCNVSLIVRDKVTKQRPETTIFEDKGEPKRIRKWGSSAYQPNALPLDQTGSHHRPWVNASFKAYCLFYSEPHRCALIDTINKNKNKQNKTKWREKRKEKRRKNDKKHVNSKYCICKLATAFVPNMSAPHPRTLSSTSSCGFAWSDMEHGCMVYTGLAPRRLQFHVAPAMPAL